MLPNPFVGSKPLESTNKKNRESKQDLTKENEKKDRTEIRLINIQGLTQIKASEIEELVSENSLFCITETQQRYNKIRFMDNTKYISVMREKEDKKGGGIMVVYKESENVEVKEIKTRDSDVLYVECNYFGYTFSLLRLLIF